VKISIGAYSFFNTLLEGKMDVFGYLETIKYRYNLDTVDLWNGFFAKKDGVLLTLPNEDYLWKIREALDEREMTLINIAIDGSHIWDPNPEIREKLYQNALSYLKASAILGAKTVRIDTGGSDFSSMSDEQFDYVVKRYQEYCDYGAEHGFTVGPENHVGPSLNPKIMKKIAEAVDHLNFGILLHIGRWKEDEEVGDKLVAPWVVHTHFDARTATSKDAVNTVKSLVDAGYDGYWGIEYNAPTNQYVEVELLIATIKKVLREAEVY
jgi:sugar phosphate isomerase/epimerase